MQTRRCCRAAEQLSRIGQFACKPPRLDRPSIALGGCLGNGKSRDEF